MKKEHRALQTIVSVICCTGTKYGGQARIAEVQSRWGDAHMHYYIQHCVL